MVTTTSLHNTENDIKKNPMSYWESFRSLHLSDTSNNLAFKNRLSETKFAATMGKRLLIGTNSEDNALWLNDRTKTAASRFVNGISLGEIDGVDFLYMPGLFPAPQESPNGEVKNKKTERPNGQQENKISVNIPEQSLHDAFVKKHQVYVFSKYYFRYLPFLGAGPWWTLHAMRQLGYLSKTNPICDGDTLIKSTKNIGAVVGASRKAVESQINAGKLDWFLSVDKTPAYKIVNAVVNRSANQYVFHSVFPPTPVDEDILKNWLFDNGIAKDPIKTISILLDENTAISNILPPIQPAPSKEQKSRTSLSHNFESLILSCVKMESLSLEDKNEILKIANAASEKIEKSFGLVNVPLYFMRNQIKKLGPIASVAITLIRSMCFISEEEVRLTGKIANGKTQLSQQLGVTAKYLDKFFTISKKEKRVSKENKKLTDKQAKIEKSRTIFKQFVSISPLEIGKSKITVSTPLRFTIPPVETLTHEHEIEKNRAIGIISAFIEEKSTDFSHDEIKEYLANNIEETNLPYIKETLFPEEKETNLPIVEETYLPNGKEIILPIGGETNIPDDVETNLPVSQDTKLPKLKYLTTLTSKILENILLNLTTNNNTKNNIGVDDIDWKYNNLLRYISYSRDQKDQITTTLSESELAAWVLYTYSAAKEFKNPSGFIYSKVKESDKSAYSGRIKDLIDLGPKELGLLFDFQLSNKTYYSNRDYKGNRSWVSLGFPNIDNVRLKEIGEKLGVIYNREQIT